MQTSADTSTFQDAATYRIRVRGQLSASLAEFLGEEALELDGPDTLLISLLDQAALFGLLRKIRDLGLPLVSVERVKEAIGSPRSGSKPHIAPSPSKKENPMTPQPQNTRLQKLGGLAALTEALTFVVGFALFFTALAAADYGNFSEPVRNAAFLAENETLLNVWHFVIYILFGVALVPLTLALQNRLSGNPALAQLGGVFGFIWAVLVIASGMVANVGGGVVSRLYAQDPEAAGVLWLNVQVIVDALGGGNETVGGVWLLLVSWAALSVRQLPKALNVLGLVVGAAAVLTNVPPLSEIGGIIFGLGLIVWFVWAGLALLRTQPAPLRQAEGRYA